MQYFVLTQKKERGCPIGKLNCVLYDKYYTPKEAGKIEYGSYPWYNYHYDGIISFDGLVLIAKERLCEFDIRKGGKSQRFYIVSERFLSLLKRFSAPITECGAISVCSSAGKPISSKQYYAVRFEELLFAEVADQENSMIEPDPRRIHKLAIRQDCSMRFFKLGDVIPHHDCLYCSEEFQREAINLGVQGIEFVPVEKFNWNKAYAVDYNFPIPI